MSAVNVNQPGQVQPAQRTKTIVVRAISTKPKKNGLKRKRDDIRTRVLAIVSQRLDANLPIVAPEGNRGFVYRGLKRAFDLIGALALLIALSPIMLATLLILTITTRGKPIFVQQRIGYLGRRFPMLKFRTMHLNADAIQKQVKNEKDGPIFKNRRDPRITPLGRILRKTSIDEMPQLFNILAGHMALVGPRPPVEKEVRQYEPWQLRRLAIMPGLTCLWQVSGRSEVGFQDWVRMDLWYANHQNLGTDFDLLVRTPKSVLSGRGAIDAQACLKQGDALATDNC